VKLVSSVKTIQPGSAFNVGLVMKMDSGWHTYWQYSGEAGLPTEVKWKLPNGFRAGEVRWPIPNKYNESGEVITFGYADETMLLIQLTTPATLSPGRTVTLKAEVSWLECERICVPGSQNVELTLPIAAPAPDADNITLFAAYEALVPPAFSASSPITYTHSMVGSMLELRVTPKETGALVVAGDRLPDFYPVPPEVIAVGRTVVEASENGATLRMPLSVYERVKGVQTFRGLIVFQLVGGKREGAFVEFVIPPGVAEALPIAGEAGGSTDILNQTFTSVGQETSTESIFLYVFYAIIGGILLNIMPCVLPVIGLKIFGLVKMSGDNPRKVKRLGWAFSLGILASFMALALVVIVLKTAGEQVGWGFQFQEPLFVIMMSAVVFAFGLSLFGVYEITLPGAAVAGLSAAAGDTARKEGGYGASFSEGIFATILATPCTAPILGTALGFAFAQPAGIVLLIFSATALGMALPYLILTTKPAWMKFMPKPGEWMVTAKQFMGFLMMATLLWLLYVLGKQLGMEGVIWTSAFLLTIGISCWMIGRFATLTASRAAVVRTWSLAILVTVAGYALFLESILDVRSVIAGVSTSVADGSHESDGIPWQPFSLDRLNKELQDKQAVFIDFTAEWCLTCKVNEKTVLADDEVVARFRTRGIVPLKADWTNRNPDITKLLGKFGRSGVPLYVVFPAGRPGEPIVLPEVITAGMVIEALDAAGPAQSVLPSP
jgi:thiol:disulfide interchange protein DsbD